MVAVRAGALALIFTLALAAASCIVETEHSIIDTLAPPDKRLVGVWTLEADGGAQVLVLHQKEDEPSQLHATFVLVNDGEMPPASRALVRLGQIGGRAYFEARWRPGEWLPLDPPVRQAIGTYELSGAGAETLKLCFADPESFEAPLKNGALKGFSGKGDSYERRVVISSDGPALRAYLAKNHFKCTVSATYRRVTGPAQSK